MKDQGPTHEPPHWVPPRGADSEAPNRARVQPPSPIEPAYHHAGFHEQSPDLHDGPPRRRSRDAMVEPPRPAATAMGRVSQVVDFAFFVLSALLTMRFVLTALNARTDTGFVRFVRTATQPFYLPFKDIVPPLDVNGHTVSISILIALIAYALLYTAVDRLLHMVVQRKILV